MDMSDKLVAEAADELERDREQLRAESRAPVASDVSRSWWIELVTSSVLRAAR